MWMDWLARWAVIGGLSLVDAAWLWARGTGFAFSAVDGRLRLAGTCLVFCLGAALLTSRYRLASAVVAKTSAVGFLKSRMNASKITFEIATWRPDFASG